MYSEVAAQAMARANGDPAAMTSELFAMLGDCSLPLAHDGPVTIDAAPENPPPSINIDYLLNPDYRTDNYYASQTVNNAFSNVTNETTVNNGFAQYSTGVSFFATLIAQEFYGDNITINKIKKKGYDFEDVEVVKDVTFSAVADFSACTLTVTSNVEKVTIASLKKKPAPTKKEPLDQTSLNPKSNPQPVTSPARNPVYQPPRPRLPLP